MIGEFVLRAIGLNLDENRHGKFGHLFVSN